MSSAGRGRGGVRATWRAVSLGLVVAATLATPALAQDRVGGLLSALNYGIDGGGMVPSGRQGLTLTSGPTFGALAYRETDLGFVMGLEGSYTRSPDALNTHILMLDLFGRLSPTPEDYRAYLQMALGAYHVARDPSATIETAGTRTRPGGSFAVGVDPVVFNTFKLGAVFSYHGIVLSRRSALSYITATLNLTFTPSPF